jgi:hypothetical protein
MANIDVNKTLKYWTEGTSGELIKAKSTSPAGIQVYWYNGSTDGFLAGATVKIKPRYFAVLIGF